MENQFILIIVSIITFFIYSVILWQISKKQKLKKQDLKTALLVIGIAFLSGLVLFLISLIITLPRAVRILISIFTFILIPILIKKFYEISWKKAIKFYFYILLISLLIIFIISFLIVIITPFLKKYI